jgi:uncharacterized protein with gpF-like domain
VGLRSKGEAMMSIKMTEAEHYKQRKKDSNAQRKRIMQSVDTFPYLMLDVTDTRIARPECCEMDGKVRRWDDQFWQNNFPPCEKKGCLCRVIAYTEGMLKRRGLTVEGSE